MCVLAHPNGTSAVIACRTLMVRSVDVTTDEVLREFRGPKGFVTTMAFDPSGTLLATGAADRSVMVSARDSARTHHTVLFILLHCWLLDTVAERFSVTVDMLPRGFSLCITSRNCCRVHRFAVTLLLTGLGRR